MPRKWKNSDDVTYYTEKAQNNRLERLRKELIPGYKDNKGRQNSKPTQYKNRHNNRNNNKK